jgi:GTP-binding protein Era
MSEPAHRAGVVALLGRPNAGKSTLLNRLLGEKLAIVSRKPQTTRSRIAGILSLPHAQLVLLDTPGLHAGNQPLNAAMNEMVAEAARDCDVALVLVDLTRGWEPAHEGLWQELGQRRKPRLLVGTQRDRAPRAVWPPPALEGAAAAYGVSARTGEGLDALREAIVVRLPESPPLYPEDEISDRPLRFLVAERVREAAFEALSQELPYALAVEVVEYDEGRPDLVRIRADLIVERDSQKRIAVGSGGAVIKQIGTRARREIESWLDTRVHLELWVKVEPRWARKPKRLKMLGYC